MTPPTSAPRRGRAATLVSAALVSARRYKRPLQFALVALIILFLALSLRQSWSQLASYQWRVQWGLLLLAFLLFSAQELSFALIWRAILRRLGARLGVVASERIYLGAEFVRYIPGNIWHVITRVLWAERYGVAKSVGFASMVIELATKIVAAALIFAFSLAFWPAAHVLAANIPRPTLIGLAILGVPLLLLGLHPRLLGALLARGMRLLKREAPTLTVGYRDILLITAYWVVSWIIVGVGFYLLVRSIVSAPLPASAMLIAIGMYAIAWDIGFLSFVTPSGVGFREAAFVFLLTSAGFTPAGDAALALVIAIVARLLTTGAELACIAVAHLVAPGDTRPAPPAAAERRASVLS